MFDPWLTVEHTLIQTSHTHRDLLTSHLISEVRQRHPGRINFHFNNTLEGLNLQDRTAAFRDVAAEEAHTACTTVPFDFFIGADGSNSK